MKEQFISLLMSTKRAGIRELIEYLETDTDFFIAPASSNYHGNYEKGLLEHSMGVYENLLKLNQLYEIKIKEDSLIIISLLHDICKINFYFLTMKGVKRKLDNGDFALNEYGKQIWDNEMRYEINDKLPLGHGEKSVIIIQQFIKLTQEEIFCINWHMMSYDDRVRGYAGNLSLTSALNLYPSISLTHCADLLSISNKLIKEDESKNIDAIHFKTEKDLEKEMF
jgi:hypothetical protein